MANDNPTPRLPPLRRLRALARLPFRFRNWLRAGFDLARGLEPTRLLLRDGADLAGLADAALRMVVHEIFFEHHYAPPELPLGPADSVLDVGANIGVFSVWAARQTTGPVVAVEPFLENFAALQRNLAVNRLAHARPIRAAVSDRAGSARLFLGSMAGGHSLSDHTLDGPLSDSIEVETLTLPAVAERAGLDRIDYLKIDCEGAEGLIFSSTPADWWDRVGKVALEFHDNVSALDHDAIGARLRAAGFRVRAAWDGRSPFGYLYAWRG